MATTQPVVPFQRQFDSQSSRTCGAACLSMVYQSLGLEVTQEEIWPAIAKPNRAGAVSSTTHLMVQDALNRGFRGLAIQARHPIQTLRLCRQWKIGAILNHRLHAGSTVGHYTVLVDVDDQKAIVHDPFFGPWQSLSHAELLDLWQPGFPASEAVGHILIGIASAPGAEVVCEFCHTRIPPAIACPNCRGRVGLAPAELLGCINDGCIARMWNYLCCPACDTSFTINMDSPPAPEPDRAKEEKAGEPGAAEERLVDLAPLFAEIDKFCRFILSVPEAAGHPEVKKQLEVLASSKDQLILAQTEALFHKKAYETQIADLLRAAQQKHEAHLRKVEEVNRQSPPLDGRGLGQALLKNLGFTA